MTRSIFSLADGTLLVTFLITSIIVGKLSARAKRRAEEAEMRQDEIARLYIDLQQENSERKNAEAALRKSQEELEMRVQQRTLDGRAASRRIKAGADGQATMIIALTASSFEEERADILRKPFQEADLFALMQKHLGVRFVYEDDDVAASTSVQVNATALEQALIQLDTIAVANAIGAVADALAMLASEFQYKRMLQLIQDVDRKEQT